MNMMSQIRKRVSETGDATISLDEYNQLQNEWITRVGIDNSSFQPMTTAPKDKQVVLDVGYPWSVVGFYNPIDQEWVYASVQAEVLEDGCSYYYENDYEKTPKGWMHLPEVSKWVI